VNIVKAMLDARGWVDIQDIIDKKRSGNNYKVYAIFDGRMKDANKQKTLALLNNANNIDGKVVRVVIGSPSIREGVSFKHVQRLHLVDPVWNQASKTQIEGRVSRYCSHVDIPVDHPFLNRSVVNISYILYNDDNPENEVELKTCDEYIYETIIPAKRELVNYIDTLLQKVSIDYFMFRHVYTGHVFGDLRTTAEIKDDENIENDRIRERLQNAKKTRRVTIVAPKSTCPPKRRPDSNGNCPAGMEPRMNRQGHPCCYKTKPKPNTAAAAAKTKCPPKRRVDSNGNCPAGMEPRMNKQGHPCCYKTKPTRKSPKKPPV
jgi:hypothetical protein